MAGNLHWTFNVDATLGYRALLGTSRPESIRGRRSPDGKIRANYTYKPLLLTPIQRRQMTVTNLVLVAAMNYIGFRLPIIAGASHVSYLRSIA